MCPGTFLGKGMELRRTERIHLDERPRQDGCHALPAGLPCYSLAPAEGLAGKSLKLSCARPPADGRSGELLGSGSAPRASSSSPARSRRGRTWTPSAAGAGPNGPRDEQGNRPEPPAAGKVQVRAGGEGFEPPKPLRVLRLSRPPRSSAPASPRASVAVRPARASGTHRAGTGGGPRGGPPIRRRAGGSPGWRSGSGRL